jgi:hypothetical protein
MAGCSEGGGDRQAAEGSKQKEPLELTVELLYEKPIREIDRELGFNGVTEVLGALKERASNGEVRALKRLFDILSVSDGYVTEGVSFALSEVFKKEPAFVLGNALSLDKDERDMLFKAIMLQLYYGRIFSGKYPPEFDDIRKLGEPSARFVKMYEYYLKHPEHLEDWSIDVPE